MAKKTPEKKSTKKEAADPVNDTDKFNEKICRIKHESMEKEIKNSKVDADKRHEELKTLIVSFKDSMEENHNNLKDKIVLTEKTLGDKIDKLSKFDDSLKGNGTPGVWESIRTLKTATKFAFFLIVILIILEFDGSFKGVTWDKVRDRLGVSNTETKQVETSEETSDPVEKETKIVE